MDHDIRHELSTITLLASVLNSSAELTPESRARVAQILAEAKWLEELVRAYDQDLDDEEAARRGRSTALRIDLVAADILRPVRMSSPLQITLDAAPVTAQINRLAFWRVLRNLLCNSVQAAGPDGRIAVQIYETEQHAVVAVDDDGPGFDPSRTTVTSLGLRIVEELVEQSGGELAIGRGALGGCGVRLRLPRTDDA